MGKQKSLALNEKDAVALSLKISDNIEIKDVRVIESSFKQTPNANVGSKSVEIDNTANVELDADNKFIFVIADFNLNAFVKNNEKPVVMINASFLLTYDYKDEFVGFPDEAFKKFAEMNGMYNAWPYWREFVQNATVRMGLPSLTIPVFRLFASKKADAPKKETKTKKKTSKKKNTKKKTTRKKTASKKTG